MSQEYKETPGIYVTKGDHLVIGNCLFLEMQEQTYPLELDRVEELPGILEDRFSSLPDNLILYVDIYFNMEETAEKVRQILGYKQEAMLYDNMFTKIYVLTK